ncbi:hypothetical protein KXX16_009622 [Aspergillus fumigatus]|nr:hypothetical protein KXX45_009117 [Aspergillus fumigatus]KAH1289281.1 hypothetical protein KXX30_007018 [Aspergillus fumigatus]KAH1290054.1 hypothetical protein KXX48_008106 [Aspergillus fumigatus]KAH1311142.1 hypothetical protein KXX66_008444 [Aspergillus fumigatus]KAH1318451.1 hypothetical protein KXX47_002449 [Aspergillus fumigatus]
MAASIAPECNDLKEYISPQRLPLATTDRELELTAPRKYDTCFLKWYSEKYLRGKTSSNECEELFSKYKSCLHKALKEKGIDTMVEEARKSTASESDADYLRKT